MVWPISTQKRRFPFEKVRVHLRCFEMKPAIFSMSNLVSLPFQRRPPKEQRTLKSPRASPTACNGHAEFSTVRQSRRILTIIAELRNSAPNKLNN